MKYYACLTEAELLWIFNSYRLLSTQMKYAIGKVNPNVTYSSNCILSYSNVKFDVHCLLCIDITIIITTFAPDEGHLQHL